MTAVQYSLHLEAGAQWSRTIDSSIPGIVLPSVVTEARMTVRNSMNVVVMTLDSSGTSPAITIVPGTGNNPPTYVLNLTSTQTLQYGVGFPGVVQSVSYWGIGRAFLYDLFVTGGGSEWAKLLYGTIQVVPAITTTLT